MSYKVTKPGLVSVLYLSRHYMVLGPFLCIVSFHCYVCCLLVVLVKISVLAKWLARKLLFCVSLGSWVISLTVLGASVTNLNEPPRALATSAIMWVRSYSSIPFGPLSTKATRKGGYYLAGPPLLNRRCISLLRVPVSEMTYTVSSGTLNFTIPYRRYR